MIQFEWLIGAEAKLTSAIPFSYLQYICISLLLWLIMILLSKQADLANILCTNNMCMNSDKSKVLWGLLYTVLTAWLCYLGFI